jgi:hypothetical protein
VKVKDVIRLLEKNDWYLVPTRGQSSSIQPSQQTGHGYYIGKRKRRHAARNIEQRSEAGWIEVGEAR